jgi:NAD-dependent SIR2 family protein deacetylase
MAYTAIENEDEKKEYFDSPEELEVKVEMLADMIKASSTFCAFTGAGISTACGIPDYRSGFNTVMDTGPGGWETAANKEKYKKLMVEKEKKAKAGGKKEIRTSIQKAYPSFTHMSLFELCERERLKFIISQNVDGLHRKSGVPAHCLAELHGNTNLEVCEKCGTEYMRDMRVRNAKSTKEHRTGRKCDNPSCQGPLKDTIINFNENLNDNILEMGFQMAGASDLILCMGSSMRVSPACEMPVSTVQNGGNLVMINLQKTPIDGHATLILNGKCDDIMRLLMKKLDYDVPVW